MFLGASDVLIPKKWGSRVRKKIPGPCRRPNGLAKSDEIWHGNT